MMKKIVLAFLVSISFANFCVTTADDRPNILWVVSEDNSHHWLGCYGNEQVSTPNIDQLATEGVRYKFAYSNAPVCAVARSTLITGRYACSIGTQNMRSRYPIPSDIQPFVSYLRDSDYYCVNRSKLITTLKQMIKAIGMIQAVKPIGKIAQKESLSLLSSIRA